MKKLIFLALLIFPLSLFSQQSMTAVFDSKKEMVVKAENSSYAEFKLMATAEEITYAREEAAKYSAYMTFEAVSAEDGVYNCKLSFNHIIHHAYIHKMLVAFAVEKFTWNEQSYGLNQWFEVFKM